MAIVAPLSKYKKQNYMIAIAVCIGLAVWCVYDGYFNQKFIQENTVITDTGEEKLGEWLIFNRYAPPFLVLGAIYAAIRFFMTKDKKLVADENSLVAPKKEIPYDSIEKIDKTHFKKKGYFVVTYKDDSNERTAKFSDRTYDNLDAVLDELVKKIS